MKLKVQKQTHGAIKIELTHDATKKPILFMMEPPQALVLILIEILNAARRADSFCFEVELK